jgi:hypothetical protein
VLRRHHVVCSSLVPVKDSEFRSGRRGLRRHRRHPAHSLPRSKLGKCQNATFLPTFDTHSTGTVQARRIITDRGRQLRCGRPTQSRASYEFCTLGVEELKQKSRGLDHGCDGAAQLVAEAVKPPIRWPGAEAPVPAFATASRQLQIAPAARVFVAATAAPRRGWHARRLAA